MQAPSFTQTTQLLLIRHGETAWNAEGRIQGQLDVPLSAKGTWQAHRLAQRLAHESVDAVIASDLARAWLTACPIAQSLKLEVIAEPRLRERRFGIFEGHRMEDVAQRWPQEFAAWRSRDPAWSMPKGESAQQFIDRVVKALSDLASHWQGRTVVLVAHGGVLDVVYRQARGLSWDALREHAMLNCALNRVTASAKPLKLVIDDWADIKHLDHALNEINT